MNKQDCVYELSFVFCGFVCSLFRDVCHGPWGSYNIELWCYNHSLILCIPSLISKSIACKLLVIFFALVICVLRSP
jgi:hypothetical protein